MKVTKKIGNKYYTIEDDEIDNFAPRSLKEAVLMTISCSFWTMAIIAIFGLISKTLEYFFPM